jgi:hypothetical protein
VPDGDRSRAVDERIEGVEADSREGRESGLDRKPKPGNVFDLVDRDHDRHARVRR